MSDPSGQPSNGVHLLRLEQLGLGFREPLIRLERFAVQARVLNGDGGLVGERLQQRDVRLGEGPSGDISDREGADDVAS